LEISINQEIETAWVYLEESLRKTNEEVIQFQKELIYEVVTKQFSDQYIRKQRRLNSLKSPFIKARELLQEMLGENIEKIATEEYIDMSPVEIEKDNTREILENLSYEESVKYIIEANKNGLKKTNIRKRELI